MSRWTVLIFMIIFSRCDSSIHLDKCDLDNLTILGDWKLIKECHCYTMGGDFIWKATTKNRTLSFDQNCNVIEGGENLTICSTLGKFRIDQDELISIFTCPNGTKTTGIYEYSISSNGDTLTLKTNADEGYFGSKLLRQ